MKIEISGDVPTGWKQVIPPPPNYGIVLRRSFENGSHSLVLVRQEGDQYKILSSVDHGTVRPSVTTEGEAATLGDAIEVLCKTCATWDNPCEVLTSTEPPVPQKFFYVGEGGKLNGPALRDDLFELIRTGAISWEAQVWEEIHSSSERGNWEPIMNALGFPIDHY